MHLVLGGTGKTGRRVADRLTRLGQPLRIGSRRHTPPFDWHDAATWGPALDGARSVYITYQPDLAVPGARGHIQGLVDAAAAAGVHKLVLMSGKGETEAQACEEIVKAGAADWTIVRASWFQQNFSENFLRDPVLAGHVALPRADALIPFVDADDIADVVVAALLRQDLAGQVLELTGPRQLTFADAIGEIAAAVGRPIGFTPITLEAYEQMLRQAGLPDDVVWLVTYLFAETLTPENAVVTDDVRRVLGRPARDFTDYARAAAAAGAWDPVAAAVTG